jgi:hypothetical protein
VTLSAATLRAAATEWLRYERRCYIVTWERGPWGHLNHRPDVMGVPPSRQLTEIEIKRSFADFKHDAEKNIWQHRDLFKRAWPAFFYYLVTPELTEKCLPLVRDGCGLLTVDPAQLTYAGLPAVTCVKRATRCRDARRLTLRQLVEMVRHQSGTLASAAAQLARLPAETPVSETGAN